MKKRTMGLTTLIAVSAIVGTLSLNANAGVIKNIEIMDIKTAINSVEKAVGIGENETTVKEVAVAAGKKSSDTAVDSAAPTGSSKKAQPAVAETEETGSAATSDATTEQAAPDSTANTAPSNATEAAAPVPEAAPQEASGILSNGNAQVDISSIADGVVRVRYPHESGLKIKVKIALGSSSYMYSLYSTSGYETYPLQMGNGNYTITVYENIGGTSYTAAAKFDVTLNDSSNVFLNSIQLINWNSSTNAVLKAKEIASAYGSDEAKAQAIHDFLSIHMQYDSAKASSVASGYVPNINEVYGSGYGICYDFASTYAAMLRSVGIPTKLVMGYSSNVTGYHAWNKVYLNGSWVVVDNSYDSQVIALGQNPEWIKSGSLYNGQKEY